MLQLQHVFDADFHVARLAFGAAEDLVDHDVGVGEGEAFALGAAAEEHRAHACRLADAVGVHVAGHELHGVVDGEAGGDAAAGGIDVEMHLFFRVGHLQEQQLRDDEIGDHVIDRRAEEDDAVNEQAGVDVIAALAATGLFHHHGDEEIFHNWEKPWRGS